MLVIGTSERGAAAQQVKHDAPSKCWATSDSRPTDRTEKWLDHFEVYERTRSGDEYRLSGSVQLIDVHSDLVVKRTSGTPEKIYAQNTEVEIDDSVQTFENGGRRPCARVLNDGFDIDAMRWRWNEHVHRECPTPIALDGLQYSDSYGRSKWKWPWPDCPVQVRALTTGVPIAKGDSFTLPAAHLHHGDRIELELYGDRIADVGTAKCDNDETSCSVTYSAIWASLTKLTIVAVDFGQIRVFDVRKRVRRELSSTSRRTRIDGDVVVAFQLAAPSGVQFTIDPQGSGNVLIEGQRISREGEVSALSLILNNGTPTIRGLHDGDQVTVTVKRRVQAGSATSWQQQSLHHFRAAAIGLHYAPTGDRRADYSTSSALLLPFGSTESLGFSQTFAYSLFYRTEEPGFLDHVGIGFHVALLAVDSSDTEADPTFSLGLGGQFTFGGQALHLGGGYDVRRDDGYLLIGLALDEFVKFVGRGLAK